MPAASSLIAFSLVALGMVLTPGPNMIYLVSRTICQGQAAGLISLIGVALGFLFYMLCAALGITSLVMAVPYAYDALRLGGAVYLLYLAWQAVRPGARTAFEVQNLPKQGPAKLITMGFITNLLNPKIAVMYLSLLPQFIEVQRGSVLTQALALGTAQIIVSISVNTLIVFTAGAIAVHLSRRPLWAQVQRWFMGTVLAGLAVRMAFESRK